MTDAIAGRSRVGEGSEGGVRAFRPARWLPGGHLQTVLPSMFPAPCVAVSRRLVVEVEPGSAVEVLVSEPARVSPRRATGTVLLVHGLGGSAESGYQRRLAAAALASGWSVARVNLRNCGGTAALASTLYNVGQSGDIGRALEALEREGLPRPFGVVSFSLGANQVLLHAAESGDGCAADAIVAVNPPVDLAAADRAIRRPPNAPYHVNYTRSLCRLLNEVRAVREVPGPPARWWRIRTVRRFDEVFTVPDAGHPDVDTYYAAASSGPLLGRIARPTLVLSAADDPIVRVESFEAYRPPIGHAVRFEHPRTGGHGGYWAAEEPRYWAGERALGFLEEALGR